MEFAFHRQWHSDTIFSTPGKYGNKSVPHTAGAQIFIYGQLLSSAGYSIAPALVWWEGLHTFCTTVLRCSVNTIELSVLLCEMSLYIFILNQITSCIFCLWQVSLRPYLRNFWYIFMPRPQKRSGPSEIRLKDVGTLGVILHDDRISGGSAHFRFKK